MINSGEKYIFNLINQSVTPISFNDIYLNTEFKENTCRRYLQQLHAKGLISRVTIKNRTHFTLTANGHSFAVSGKFAKISQRQLSIYFIKCTVQRKPILLVNL